MRINVVLSSYNLAIYLGQNRHNYVGKTCSQKFLLRVRFFTCLDFFVHVWGRVRARAITRLS